MTTTMAMLGLLFIMTACASPEANRARGGGPGGDKGNRGEVVEMHAGSEPYHKTPRLIGSAARDVADENRQANRR
jgi:hypothetical protein